MRMKRDNDSAPTGLATARQRSLDHCQVPQMEPIENADR
jgi:hypothetical protein